MMSVNLANRFFRNSSSYNTLIKSPLLRNVTGCRRVPQTCKCTTLANITSKKWFTYNGRCIAFIQKKFYCEESSSPPSNKLPPLMPDVPKIVWPSLLKSIRNFILATFIIRPYFDNDFSLSEFVLGSKKAVEVVSKNLSEGNMEALEGLVTKDIIPILQKSLPLLSLSQRELVAIAEDDIYFCFPYQVGIIFNEEEGKEQKRFVEITMVYHTLKGLDSMRSKGEEPPVNMGMLPEYQQKISISNYRFIREFTKGVEDSWTINLLNHFRPIDDEQQSK
ncbi:unnamed protein product [Acanthoscelides obtectus]|uniref:Uncharacterized protein n=1 Tax=Acanthoscelides obtectus TaxID=200917 RepID=A0A9P0NT66_ACAOB|nr:unnamed protein product [Acanthoscelides obtectus]CAK1657896.1 m-AAA protease-interacting protein 1, mitochondrial [Acanthoscelides obtectus]